MKLLVALTNGFLAMCMAEEVHIHRHVPGKAKKRLVRIEGPFSKRQFYDQKTGKPVILNGPNIVMKGPPWLPDVSGDTICNDNVNENCWTKGTCTSCSTFNEADVKHIKSMGWNTIRLSVIWDGAQPEDKDELGADFLRRLKAILTLTDRTELYVLLDNHGDMTGTANCGSGVPMWFSRLAAPELIGKPLETKLPYSLIPQLRIEDMDGWKTCGKDETKWAKYSDDDLYYLKNECCLGVNGGDSAKPAPNSIQVGWTSLAQKTMDYMILPGKGRKKFARFWRLMAEAVKDHPSAVACELYNEPQAWFRPAMYETWRVAATAINKVIPDMSISLADLGNFVLQPAFMTKYLGAYPFIWPWTERWIKRTKTLFYAWHWYGVPSSVNTAVRWAAAIGRKWGVAVWATEFMSCDEWNAAAAAGMSHTYWHYSAYCNTGPAFGSPTVPTDTFGACVLGWADGNSEYKCSASLAQGGRQKIQKKRRLRAYSDHGDSMSMMQDFMDANYQEDDDEFADAHNASTHEEL